MFYFSLALRLGKTVKQLLQELNANELAEWRAYFRLLEQIAEGEDKTDLAEDLKKAFLSL